MLPIFSKIKSSSSSIFLLPLLFLLATQPGCMPSFDADSTSNESDATTSQFLIIPNASWYSGAPTYSPAVGGTAPTATMTDGNQILTVGSTVTWEVSLEAIIEVEADVSVVVITDDELDGYFTYPITETDIQNGFVEIEMGLEESAPSEAVCNRDYNGNGTCYEQADSGVTGADFAVANDIGGEMTLTASVEVEVVITEVIDSTDSTDDGTGTGTSSGDATCSAWTDMCSCSLRACSDGTNSWYDVGSGVYYCASTSNCTAAANSAVAWCTSGC